MNQRHLNIAVTEAELRDLTFLKGALGHRTWQEFMSAASKALRRCHRNRLRKLVSSPDDASVDAAEAS